ncbi:DUF6922 domain-containing protein [Dinghuibacter silviterrae]|uniref:DUF6922 domain-containing protein n=1 Tax=Dinghuibacter silviterrae TaxID=1539049 RepID=A0A4R8DPV2_9BACT|nr:hypothetical protein [Dinghuibacter silviterrae]TDW99785.1 hypothetical protein EDB95_0796 [Dinghuibacter silviterrae]
MDHQHFTTQSTQDSNAGKGPPLALPKRLFWDFDYDNIDWQKDCASVIERVIERGTNEEWQVLIRYYGYEEVVHALKYESTYLMDHTIDKVCAYFKLEREDLRCYRRKQSRPRLWL